MRTGTNLSVLAFLYHLSQRLKTASSIHGGLYDSCIHSVDLFQQIGSQFVVRGVQSTRSCHDLFVRDDWDMSLVLFICSNDRSIHGLEAMD